MSWPALFDAMGLIAALAGGLLVFRGSWRRWTPEIGFSILVILALMAAFSLIGLLSSLGLAECPGPIRVAVDLMIPLMWGLFFWVWVQHLTGLEIRSAQARSQWMTTHPRVLAWTSDTDLRLLVARVLPDSLTDEAPSSEFFPGRPLADLFQAENPDSEPLAAHRRALAGQVSEFDHSWGDRVFHCRVEAIKDGRGRPTGVQGLARDVTEQRKAEEALKITESKYRAVVDNALEGIVVVQDGRLVFYNHRFESETAYTADVLDRSYIEFIHPDDLPLVADRYERRLRGEGLDYPFVCRVLVADGGVRWVEIKAIPTLWEGKPAHIYFFKDATDLKEAEAARVESELQYKTLFQESLSAIFVLDEEARFVDANRAGLDFLACDREELLGRTLWDFSPPDQLERQKKAHGTFTRPRVQETNFLVGDSIKQLLLNMVPSKHRGRTMLFAIGQDVTPYRRVEEGLEASREALKKQRDLFNNTIEALTHPFYVIDPYTYQVLLANRAAGVTAGDSPMTCHALTHKRSTPCSGEEAACPVDEIVATGRPATVEHLHFDAQGLPRYHEVHSYPVFDEQGRVAQVIVYSLDITSRKRYEEERKGLEMQLRQAQKMEAIGTLAGGIAHDFNNILAAISGYTELAIFKQANMQKTRENLEQVLKASERARQLIAQILTFSRQSEQELKPLELEPIVKESLKFLRASLPSTIRIDTEMTVGSSVVLADPGQMQQVLMNLCTNASHAMYDRGGILTVRLEKVEMTAEDRTRPSVLAPGRYLRLTVGDTGPGMPPEVLARIFEPYFTTKKPGEGTGLGLAVVHGIVKSHGGTIVTESEPGRGSRFHVFLPLMESGTEVEAEAEETALPRGTERILFVDDEEPLVDIGRQMLEHLGYRVSTRTSSPEALELFMARPDRFDLVITDQTMPNMTGIQLSEEMTRIRPGLPVLLCTGFSLQLSEEKMKAAGIWRLLMKPLSIGQVAGVIREILDGPAEPGRGRG